MIETYTFTPYFLLIFGLITQSMLLIKYVCYPDESESDNNKSSKYDFFMFFGFSLFFSFGVLYLDTGILWLLGQYSYVEWRYQLPAVILLIILGVQYTLGGMFIKPKVFDIIYASISVALILLLSHLYIPTIEIGWRILIYYLGLILLLALIYAIISMVLNRSNSQSTYEEKVYLYDKALEFKRIFNKKVNFTLYILCAVNLWMNFFGMSLILW